MWYLNCLNYNFYLSDINCRLHKLLAFFFLSIDFYTLLESFTTTEFHKIFSGRHLHQGVKVLQCFTDENYQHLQTDQG